MKKLVQMGIDLNREYPQYVFGIEVWVHYYPIEIAVSDCLVDIVKVLLAHGASVYCKNRSDVLLKRVAQRIDHIVSYQQFAAKCNQGNHYPVFFKRDLLSDSFDPKYLPALREILTLLKHRAAEEVEGTSIYNLVVEDANDRERTTCFQNINFQAFDL